MSNIPRLPITEQGSYGISEMSNCYEVIIFARWWTPLAHNCAFIITKERLGYSDKTNERFISVPLLLRSKFASAFVYLSQFLFCKVEKIQRMKRRSLPYWLIVLWTIGTSKFNNCRCILNMFQKVKCPFHFTFYRFLHLYLLKQIRQYEIN